MSRVLVTGGAGFVGSHISRALLRRGDSVVVIDDLSHGDRDAVPDGAALIEADIADTETVGVIAGLEVDSVVHAAAQVSVVASMNDPMRDMQVNLIGTANVLTGARLAAASRIVFLSSGGAIYGESDGADERTLPAPASYYGIHKLAAEAYVALCGLPYAVARIANVYGPGQRSDLEGGVVAIFAERLSRGDPLTIYGDGQQRRDFVHVHDVTTALLAMLDSTMSGVWNVGTGRSVSINDLVTAFFGAYGMSVPINRAAERRGELRNSCLRVDRAAADLGWTAQKSLADGITDLAPPP